MGWFTFWDKKIKKMKSYDIGLLKLATAAFVLAIAAFWPPLVQISPWIYVAIFLVASVGLLNRLFG